MAQISGPELILATKSFRSHCAPLIFSYINCLWEQKCSYPLWDPFHLPLGAYRTNIYSWGCRLSKAIASGSHCGSGIEETWTQFIWPTFASKLFQQQLTCPPKGQEKSSLFNAVVSRSIGKVVQPVHFLRLILVLQNRKLFSFYIPLAVIPFPIGLS